jgi:hypothetical protein
MQRLQSEITSFVAPVLQVFPRQRTYETGVKPLDMGSSIPSGCRYKRPNGQDQLISQE